MSCMQHTTGSGSISRSITSLLAEGTAIPNVHEWTGIFGGWPNLLQGLASALIGGIVAAVAAIVVVRLTADKSRDLALQDEARQVARDLVRMLTAAFLNMPDKRPLRADREIASALNLELRFTAAILARHNLALAQQVQDQADAIKEHTDQWDRFLASDSDAVARYNDLYTSVEVLHEPIINWLGNIDPVTK